MSYEAKDQTILGIASQIPYSCQYSIWRLPFERMPCFAIICPRVGFTVLCLFSRLAYLNQSYYQAVQFTIITRQQLTQFGISCGSHKRQASPGQRRL